MPRWKTKNKKQVCACFLNLAEKEDTDGHERKNCNVKGEDIMPGAEIAQYGLATFAVAGLYFTLERTDADGTKRMVRQ